MSTPLQQVTVLTATGESDFFSPDLSHYEPKHFVSPSMTRQLAVTLAKSRLLTFGGSPIIDKYSLALHIAWYLREELALPSVETRLPRQLSVLEWKRSGAKSIDLALQEYEESAIFVLPQLLPQHINHDLGRLSRIIKERGHYVLVTAEEDGRWRSLFDPATFQHFWKDLQPEEIYTANYLVDVLRHRLFNKDTQFPIFLLNDIMIDNKISTYSLHEIATQLKTPENINDFVNLIAAAAERGPITPKEVESGLRESQGNLNRFRQWFYNLPSQREKLLVLALNFFDGLIDEQFFAAVDLLAERVWQRREPSLQSLDYYDFDKLHKFFRYVRNGRGEAIKTQLENQRTLLLNVAWTSHRRHILSAIPVFVEMISASAEANPTHWVLYGTAERRNRLRKVLSEVISDIGLRDLTAIQDTLLRLAVHANVGVQAVAGRAIARWSEYGATDQMIDTLWHLMHDPSTHMIAGGMGMPDDSEQKLLARLKVTVTLTIGYAIESLPKEKTPDILYTYLEQLSQDDTPAIRDTLCRVTLAMILPLHLDRIRDIIATLTHDFTTHRKIAKSMAEAYQKNPEEVKSTLDRWYAVCIGPDRLRIGKSLEQRNALLACVSLIYGYLPYERVPGVLSIKDAFERMRTILLQEQASLIREAALATVIRKGREHFAELEHVVGSFRPNELQRVIDELIEIFLDQRIHQRGGDTTLLIRNNNNEEDIYHVWIHAWERPRTVIEEEMFTWMQNHQNPISQQIAVQALVEFRAMLYDEEQERIEHVLGARKRLRKNPKPKMKRARKPRMIGMHNLNIFIHYIVARIVTLTAPSKLKTIQAALPEVMFQRSGWPHLIDVILQEWSWLRQRTYADIGRRLRRGVFLVRIRLVILFVVVIAIIRLAMFAWDNLHLAR